MKALKLCLLLWAALLAAANDELDSWYQPPESAWVKRMSGVAFGEGKWVIGGENAWKSEDGTNWVQTREGFGCNKVIYGLGQFVAFGHSTPSGIRYATSKTGETSRPVVEDFEYSSGTNPHFLTVAEIRHLLELGA